MEEFQRDHALYMAFAPADNPKIALAVIVENAGWGAGVAAPIARRVFDYALLGQYPNDEDMAAVRKGTAGAPIGKPLLANEVPALMPLSPPGGPGALLAASSQSVPAAAELATVEAKGKPATKAPAGIVATVAARKPAAWSSAPAASQAAAPKPATPAAAVESGQSVPTPATRALANGKVAQARPAN